MISTLVAGIDALSGSKSPIVAMFRKLLFILSKECLSFPFPLLWGPASFFRRRGKTTAGKQCVRLLGEKWIKGARERGRKRAGDVMSLLPISSSPFSPEPGGEFRFSFPFCSFSLPPSYSSSFLSQFSSVKFRTTHLVPGKSPEVLQWSLSQRNVWCRIALGVEAIMHFPCPQWCLSHDVNSV